MKVTVLKTSSLTYSSVFFKRACSAAASTTHVLLAPLCLTNGFDPHQYGEISAAVMSFRSLKSLIFQLPVNSDMSSEHADELIMRTCCHGDAETRNLLYVWLHFPEAGF